MFSLVLIDLAGTLHEGGKAVPGAVQALQRLETWAKETNATFRFVSNTTKEPKQKLTQKLRGMGFVFAEDKVFTPLESAGEVLRSLGKTRPFSLVTDASELGMPLVKENFDSVVVGLAPSKLDYANLNKAFQILKNAPESKLIALHRGKYYKDDLQQLSIGPGPFVKALEEASGVQAITVGKPSPSYFQAAVQHAERELGCKLAPEQIIMVGDDANDDALAAVRLGFYGVLVRTGKYRAGDETKVLEHSNKAHCLASFVELVDMVIQKNNKL